MRFEESTRWLDRAKAVIPSASQTYSKSYKYYCEGAAPAFLSRAEGAHVWDVDGNEFVDFVMALGAVTLGYRNREVDAALRSQLEKGISFSQSHFLEVELAEKLVDIIPCAEMVRFLKNGSDATAAAVRLARAYTEREMIACCGYHGFQDWYIGTTVNHRGVPEAVRKLTKTFQYNDLASLERVFEQYPGQVAGVIMEPVALQPPRENFLHKARELTHENGALFIFDEVVTGFRLALGGAQAYFGVTPDMASFGKGVANGMPLSFLAGPRDVMKLIDQGVFISATYGGETLSLVAALTTIGILEGPESFPRLWSMGEKWGRAVRELIDEKNLSSVMEVAGLAPHCGVVFKDFQGVPSTDYLSVYQQELIQEGVLTVGINNFCLAHSEKDVDQYISAVNESTNTLLKVVETGNAAPFLKGGKISPIFKRNQ